jgi:plasmid stabilization system protein ParE
MKIKDVVILEEVADDLNDGWTFYEEKEQGVGDYFWESLLVDIQSLFIYGGVHRRTHGLYRMLAKRFPYAVYYELADNVVYVVAVLPMRRDPTWIRGQLTGRK